MWMGACNGHGGRIETIERNLRSGSKTLGGRIPPCGREGRFGAGGRNRTDETCLEGRSFTTKLRPRGAGTQRFADRAFRSSLQHRLLPVTSAVPNRFLTGFLPGLGLPELCLCRCLERMALLTSTAPATL